MWFQALWTFSILAGGFEGFFFPPNAPFSKVIAPPSVFVERVPLFTPPPGWEAAFPKGGSPYVHIGFVGKGTTAFHPSINFATERDIGMDLKEYVKAVKETHLRDPQAKWRDWGKFQMEVGEGRLVEVYSSSHWGEVKVLQAIYVQENTAYILTAAVLKSDFFELQEEIFRALHSFSIAENLLAPVADPKARKWLEEAAHGDKDWDAVQKQVFEGYANLGSYWQYLVLKELHQNVYHLSHP